MRTTRTFPALLSIQEKNQKQSKIQTSILKQNDKNFEMTGTG